MKDIKKLYLTAKQSGRQQDVGPYVECVQDFLENHPQQYISNLEYIISSNVGLSTLREFVEKNGISIGSYNDIMMYLESGVKKCRQQEKGDILYQESITMMESFKKQYQNCFVMFEAFQDDMPKNYVEAYYKNFPLLRKAEMGKVNMSAMISRFGEACIPDMLVYTNQFGNPDVILESLCKDSGNIKLQYNYNEGVVFAIIGTLLIAPVVLLGGIIAYALILGDRELTKQRKANEKVIKQTVQGIINTTPKDLMVYEKAAGVEMSKFAEANESKILSNFYKASETETSLSLNRGAYFSTAIGKHGKYNSEVDKSKLYSEENLIFSYPEITTGLVKRADIEKIQDKLNKISEDIKLVIFKCDNLPGDDNGGTWGYYIDSKIVEGGPEDCPSDENGDSADDNWIHDQMKKIEDSGYCVVDINMIMPAKKFLVDNFLNEKELKTESAILYQWISESVKDIPKKDEALTKKIKDKSLEKIVESVKSRSAVLYRESVLTGNENVIQEYSYEDIKAMENLISFKEYQMACLENTDAVSKLQSEIYALYEGFEGLIEEDVASSIIPMLPGSQGKVSTQQVTNLNEDWTSNSASAKKTGQMPDFLKKHHDLGYGEEEPAKKADGEVDDAPEPSLDDFKRPSAAEKDDGKIVSHDYSQAADKSDGKKDDEDLELGDDGKKHSNNYYYYTYTNSNNTNANSFNKHHQDDHSTAKRIHSNDNINSRMESAPWELTMVSEGVDEFEEGMAAGLLIDEKNARPLTQQESLLAKELFGNIKCMIMKAKQGYFAATNRARTGFYAKLEDIPVSKIKFVSSTTAIPAFESPLYEEVGDADNQKPESDNPIQDTMIDADRNLASAQQALKKKVQGVVNTGRTIIKPFARTSQWIGNMISNWKDSNETNIKEKMADPHSRSTLYKAIRTAIKYGSFFKAGLLLNPVILFLVISKKISNSSKEFRIRNEMIGELKAELDIIDEKIKDANGAGDNKAKYQLIRFKNELNKKLIRVGGGKGMAKMV